jgi:hypothetical protein
MKRALPLVLIVTVALGTLVVPEAEAGWLDKWMKKDKKEESSKAHRYDLYPTMSFHKGLLGRGTGQSWELDNTNLLVRSDCEVITELGGDAQLTEGREALVMGTRFGDTIIAYQVRIMKPDYMSEGALKESEFTPSDSDPTVGEGQGPQ